MDLKDKVDSVIVLMKIECIYASLKTPISTAEILSD